MSLECYVGMKYLEQDKAEVVVFSVFMESNHPIENS